MRRPSPLPPSRFNVSDPTPADRVARAFAVARTAHLQPDAARAMHGAVALLNSGLDAYDWRPDNPADDYDDGE